MKDVVKKTGESISASTDTVTTVVSNTVNASSDVSADIEDFIGDAKTDDVQIFSLLNKMSSSKVLDPNKDYVIWLDSCANVGVFRNCNLLDDIRPGPPNSVSGFRSKVTISHIGTNAIFGKHYFESRSDKNILPHWLMEQRFNCRENDDATAFTFQIPGEARRRVLANATGYFDVTLVISMAFLR